MNLKCRLYKICRTGAFLSAPVPFSVLMYSYVLVFLPLDLVKAFLAGLLGRRLRIALQMN